MKKSTIEIYDPYQIDNTKKESWTKLNLRDIIKVEIGDEGENGKWENIFLQTIDKNSLFAFEELNKLIVEHVENVKLNGGKQQDVYDFKPLHNCLVKYDNLYCRAKVYGVYGDKVQERLYRFFLCDYACFTNAKTDNLYNDFLYETTEEIVNFTPYQAIHCTLAGIKWDKFTKRYQVTKDYLYACAVLENKDLKLSDVSLKNLPINSYKILLYECEKENDFNNASLFNKTLVDNGITVYDEDTKAFLEYEIGFPKEESNFHQESLDEKEKADDVPSSIDADKVLTFEQIMDLVKANAFDIDLSDVLPDVQKPEMNNSNNIPNGELQKVTESENIEDMEMVDKESADAATDEKKSSDKTSAGSIKSSVSSKVSDCTAPETVELILPPMKALHKRPLTTWYQNEFMLFLSIYAPDISDYHLEITPEKLYFNANIQYEESVLILNFLGSVDLTSVSHEIKGINVVIRLKKNYFIIWPRLLRESTKYSWLKYNFNAFDSIEMEYIAPQQTLHNIFDSQFSDQPIVNYNSDEDSEREMYQTYNPIQNDDDDDCDPFS